MHNKRVGTVGFGEDIFRTALKCRNAPTGEAFCKIVGERYPKIGPAGRDFDETAALTNPARTNTATVDPQITSITLPTRNYVPLNAAAVSGKATPPAGFDQTATYAGAVAPGDPEPWYTGWTAFPAN